MEKHGLVVVESQISNSAVSVLNQRAVVFPKSSRVSVGIERSGLSSRGGSASSISPGGDDSGGEVFPGCSGEGSVRTGESGWSTVSAGRSSSVAAASKVVSICWDQEKKRVVARWSGCLQMLQRTSVGHSDATWPSSAQL